MLDDRDVERIAAKVAALIVDQLRTASRSGDRWLDSREAADHLGLSLHALRHLVARRAVPFVQDRPGAKVFFKVSELDAWRASHAREPRAGV